MPTYQIQHRIRTVAYLWETIEVNGYRFESHRPLGDGDWVVSKECDGGTWLEAVNQFRRDLVPVLDATSVASQCAFSFIATSLIAQKNGDDPGLFAAYLARPTSTAGMHLGPDNLEDINNLLSADPAGMFYFRHALNTTTAHARVAFQILAAEALAGSTQIERRCPNCGEGWGTCQNCQEAIPTYSATDRRALEVMLGDELYTKLYKKESLRHKLMHGKRAPDGDVEAVVDPLYEKIIDAFVERYKLRNVPKIKNAPRSFDTFSRTSVLVRKKKLEIPFELMQVEAPLWKLLEDHRPESEDLEIITERVGEY